jgi:hypothetical protein
MKPSLVLILIAGVGPLLAGCAVPVAVAVGGYAADAGLIVATGKSSTDHLVSMNTNKDCGAWRAVTKGGPLCRDRPEGQDNPYQIDYAAPFRVESDSGVEVIGAGRDGGRLLTGDDARQTLAVHKPPVFDAGQPVPPSTAAVAVPGEARFGSAGQPAVAPTPEGADVATAGSRTRPHKR